MKFILKNRMSKPSNQRWMLHLTEQLLPRSAAGGVEAQALSEVTPLGYLIKMIMF